MAVIFDVKSYCGSNLKNQRIAVLTVGKQLEL